VNAGVGDDASVDDDGSPYLWVFREYGGVARYLWLVLPLYAGSLAATSGSAQYGEWNGKPVLIVPEDWFTECLRWAPLSVGCVLLVLWIWKRRWFPHPIGTVAACFLGWVVTWTIGGQGLSPDVAAPDGSTYAFFHRSFFQARNANLGRVVARDRMTRTLDLVEADQGEFGFIYASLVRPSNAAEDGTRVVIVHDELVLGMIGETAFASALVGKDKTLTATVLQNLSPFVLLGDSDGGVDADVDKIIEKVRYNLRVFGPERCSAWTSPTPTDAAEDRSGTPTEASLLAALESPNAWIRSAARRIAAAGGADMYPEATRRLAPTPK